MDEVINDFKEALECIKEELTKDEGTYPQLESDMRNQIIISNIKVEES